MSSFNGLFKKMDLALFKLVEALNSFSLWQQLVDRFRMLSEGNQKWINHLLSLFAAIAPLALFIILFSMNQSVRQDVDTKEQLLQSIDTLSKIKAEYLNLERVKISRTVLNDQQSAEDILKKLFEQKGISWEKASLHDFSKDENAQGLVISKFNLSFKNFTMADLTNSISVLVEKEKAVITNMAVQKNQKENTLEGSLSISHYGKGMN